MDTTNNAQSVIDTTLRSAKPQPLGDPDDERRFYSVVVPTDGHLEVIDLEAYLDEYRDRPRRKAGVFTVHDADLFIAYLAKHGLPESEVWADTIATRIVGVINAHEKAEEHCGATIADLGAGYSDHRVVYGVRPTKAWEAWTAADGKLLDQVTFAELLEDRSLDIVLPSAADMLELAQHFHTTSGATYQSSQALSSGERQFEYKENLNATAGKRGQLTIPKEFALALTPFEGADPFKVIARFRYRITDGVLRLGYRLQRPEDVVREAFLSVVEKIAEQVDAPVFRGTTAG